MAIHQIFVKLLDGHTQCLQFPSPVLSSKILILNLSSITKIPAQSLRLVTGRSEITPQTLLHSSSNLFPSATLLLRLPGGKGGFGSLLRGAASKAGHKKTNNFDACRDMSGRRLRHVNAEKKIEEWVAEAEERKLEKVAEEFLKKKGKEVRKEKGVDVEKYLEKYREDSEKCRGEVKESVRKSFGLYKESKRKVLPGVEGDAKRLKIWLGKNKMEESDSDEYDESEDEDEKYDRDGCVAEDDKLVIGAKVAHESTSASGSGGSSDGELSGGKLSEGDDDSLVSADHPSVGPSSASNDSNSESDGTIDSEKGVAQYVVAPASVVSLEDISVAVEPVAKEEIHVQTDAAEKGLESAVNVATAVIIDVMNNEEPLNFEKYNSAAELEVLGLERLKEELQSRGLKCGGTLQERASRLFLLKTTSVDKLPKKLLAKPSSAK